MLNCSDTDDISRKLPEKKVPQDKIRIYYHGMSDVSRGLAQLIHAVEKKPEFVINLRCLPSENLDSLKNEVKERKLENRVFFEEPVVPMEIPVAANRDGDIGFHLCDTNTCLNWRFALTNKFIEYSKAGLPIITSNTEEQGSIVSKYKNGWILPENTEEGISQVLEDVLKKRNRIPRMSKQSFLVADKLLRWEKYEKILAGIVIGDEKVIKKNQIRISMFGNKTKVFDEQDNKN